MGILLGNRMPSFRVVYVKFLHPLTSSSSYLKLSFHFKFISGSASITTASAADALRFQKQSNFLLEKNVKKLFWSSSSSMLRVFGVKWKEKFVCARGAEGGAEAGGGSTWGQERHNKCFRDYWISNKCPKFIVFHRISGVFSFFFTVNLKCFFVWSYVWPSKIFFFIPTSTSLPPSPFRFPIRF